MLEGLVWALIVGLVALLIAVVAFWIYAKLDEFRIQFTGWVRTKYNKEET